jgi:hypothetical protein
MAAVAPFVIVAGESVPEAGLSLAPGCAAPRIGAGVGNHGFPDGNPFERNQSGASAPPSLDPPDETTFAKENQLWSWRG